MPINLNDLFNSVDESFNNQKLEEVFNKTKNVAETMSKKSAERIEISRKKVECLDAKAKLAKHYEKYGRLQYSAFIGEEIDEQELLQCTDSIAQLREKIEILTQDIEKAKADFNESISNAAKRTREAFNGEKTVQAQEVEVTEARPVDEDNAQ